MTAPPLDRRPEAISISIEKLVADAKEGRIRLPRFQRPLRWDHDNALALLDSIYRGYPIGTLLFWKRQAPEAVVRFGTLEVSAPRRDEALWVVDGQQRLTVLATTLLVEPASAGKFGIVFNLNKRTFERWKADAASQPVLPLNVVLDSARLLEWLLEAKLPKELRDEAIRVGKNIREYSVPAYSVETTNEKVAREIFDRLNSSGKALERAEVFDALHGDWEHGEPSSLRSLASGLLDLEFGLLDEELLLKALLALEGRDISRADLRQRTAPVAQSLTNLDQAIRATVVFLKHDAGIPHIELLPYQLPLVTLARFFFLFPSPGGRDRELLARWLWRGAITGVHRGDTVGSRSTLEAVHGQPSDSVQALLRMIPQQKHLPQDLSEFKFSKARSKLEMLSLLSLEPRDLRTGALIDMGRLFPSSPDQPVEIRKIFGSLGDEKELVSSAANRILVPHGTKNVAADIQLVASKATLDSHAISPEAMAQLAKGNRKGFLAERARTIVQLVERFLRARARWDAGDQPAIEALIVREDGV